MATITGRAAVRKMLRNSIPRNANALRRGLIVGGLALQRWSQLLVPVDTGNLKNSAFTRAEGVGLSTVVLVGYTAKYALYVHESIEMKLKGQRRAGQPYHGNYWDPAGRGQAQFLVDPMRARRLELSQIVYQEAKRIVGS